MGIMCVTARDRAGYRVYPPELGSGLNEVRRNQGVIRTSEGGPSNPICWSGTSLKTLTITVKGGYLNNALQSSF